ncbi:MAG: glycosyltransferase [bacterium]|nr:glycosyltransferase [bacterium]
MDERKLTVEVVLPVYNEEEELEEHTLRLRDFLKRSLTDFSWWITIADNASTDKTSQIGRQLAQKYPEINFLRVGERGRGRAIKRSWQEGDADVFAYMDIDLSTDLKHFPPLVKSLTKGYNIAIGSRLLPGSVVKGRTLKRELISRIYNLLIKILFWTKFSDAQCGFKAVTKEVIKDLIPKIKDNEWFFDSELLIVGEKSGYKIYEESVTWIDNPGSTVRVLGTIRGDLKGLWRIFRTKPWEKIDASAQIQAD